MEEQRRAYMKKARNILGVKYNTGDCGDEVCDTE